MHSANDFIEAICNNPEDDQIRLVYADWLDENGQELRAELIRMQMEEHMGKKTGDSTWTNKFFLRAEREKYLVAKALRQDITFRPFFNPHPISRNKVQTNYDTSLVTYEYGRGFIKGIECNLATFQASIPSVWSKLPLTKIYLIDRTPEKRVLNYNRSYYCWWATDHSPSPNWHYALPRDWWESDWISEPDSEGRSASGRRSIEFRTITKAVEALSNFLVNYARTLSNLPELKF